MVGIINALMVPIMCLNMFGGIISGIWLLIIGKWAAVAIGLGIGFVSTFAFTIALIPSVLLAAPGIRLIEKGSTIIGHFLAFLSQLYVAGLLWYWCVFIFGVFLRFTGSGGAGTFPLLLWAYGVATGPIGYMASKDSPDSVSTIVATFCAMLGSAVFMIMLMLDMDPVTANLFFMAIMGMGLFVQLVIGVQMSTAMRIDKELTNR